jgi:hypothetical protein
MGAARATVDHEAIQAWVDERGGHPARVKATGSGEDPGILRIDFPGFSGEDTLEEIPWDEFFTWFDENELALLLSEEEGNRFNKFVERTSVSSPPGTTKGAARRGRAAGRKAAGSPEDVAAPGKSPSGTKQVFSRPSSRDTRSASGKASSRKGTSNRKSLREASQIDKSSTERSEGRSGDATRRSSPARTASAAKRAAATIPRSTTTKRSAGRSTASRNASSRKK